MTTLPATTYRALTFSEASFVRPNKREVIGASFELRGSIDAAALHDAYAALLAEYPVLSARIVRPDDRPHFAPGDRATAAGRGIARTTGQWDGYRQSPPDIVGDQQLSAISHADAGDRHRLTVWASHAATDGSGLIAIAVRLFELYTAHASGVPPTVLPALDFPAEPHQVMADRGHLPGELDYEERLAGTSWHGRVPSPQALRATLPAAVPGALDTDDVLRIRFSESDTAALGAAARSQGFSVHALVSALIARAELAENELAGSESSGSESGNSTADSAIALLMPVDFRGRIDPPIPLRSVTALCGFSYLAVRDDTVASIARAVSDTIRSDVRDGTVLRTAVSPMPDLATRRHGPPVLISNVGVFPDLTTPDSLQVCDFYSQIVRSASGIVDYAAAWQGAGEPPSPIGSSYLVSIFGARLSVELRVLPGTLSAETRGRILDRITRGAQELLDMGTAA